MSRFSGFFFWGGGGVGICGFAVVLRGVLGEGGVSVWCFDGEFVVECVAEMDARQCTFLRLKIRHGFQLYFSIPSDRPVVDWVARAGLPVGKEYSEVQSDFDFVFTTIRVLGGHPFVCGWCSYYQQA
jgi:hypothetical protein